MGSIRTLRARLSFSSYIHHIRYTLVRLRANPLTAAHIAPFEALRDECLQAQQEELTLLEEQAEAQARVDIADDALNALASRFSRELMNITGERRDHVLYVHYFKDKNVTELRRPVLGEQLDAMRDWIPPTQTSPHPTLRAMAPELMAAVAAGDAAATAKNDVARRRREFRDLGAKYQFVERLNATRKEIHGALAKMSHEHTGLSSDFADQFFRRDESRGEEGEPSTLEEANALVEELLAALEDARELVAVFEAEAAAEAEAEAARVADEAAIKELDKAMAALKAQRKVLEERVSDR
ncbi:hypothetical protein [Chondromyces crocatus]|uniref:Uncharacterized protein n=1 Tax=Chondromyces crocatus TaxID=52 RepID=A0A0K1E989_CHOCO|nr:hypothetical protein [Chondromyces crocatus]AKT37242.1 uncharacterized protein CMC5_013730 [Chondromyces crocatus]